MRDAYDIRLILANGYFKIYHHKLQIDIITSENYTEFKFDKIEARKIMQRLKLTKSRVILKLL